MENTCNWACILALPLVSRANLGKLPNLSEPQLSGRQKEGGYMGIAARLRRWKQKTCYLQGLSKSALCPETRLKPWTLA